MKRPEDGRPQGARLAVVWCRHEARQGGHVTFTVGAARLNKLATIMGWSKVDGVGRGGALSPPLPVRQEHLTAPLDDVPGGWRPRGHRRVMTFR